MSEPLAQRLRPRTLSEVCGQQHLLGEECVFRKTIDSGRIPNMIFYGPSGVGKTTVARIIAENSGMRLHKLNGTSASTSDIKAVLAEIGTLNSANGLLLYLDEIQYLNKKQQQWRQIPGSQAPCACRPRRRPPDTGRPPRAFEQDLHPLLPTGSAHYGFPARCPSAAEI